MKYFWWSIQNLSHEWFFFRASFPFSFKFDEVMSSFPWTEMSWWPHPLWMKSETFHGKTHSCDSWEHWYQFLPPILLLFFISYFYVHTLCVLLVIEDWSTFNLEINFLSQRIEAEVLIEGSEKTCDSALIINILSSSNSVTIYWRDRSCV